VEAILCSWTYHVYICICGFSLIEK
jgi:hypothetical protein